MDIVPALLMTAVGIFAAAYGSLVGSGGGFVVMPILLLLYPESSPAVLTAISLTGVLTAGLSGAWTYHRLGLIDYRSGLAFAVPGVPGAVLGVLIVHQIGPSQFRIVLGIMLVIAGLLLSRRPSHPRYIRRLGGISHRYIRDRQGSVYEYQFNLPLGLVANFAVGILKSLFGIGGGLIFTPFAIAVLGFPALVAAATSVFTLTFTTVAAVLVHIAMDTFAEGDSLELLPVAVGMALGSQIGPRIAQRIGGTFVVRLLAGTLVVIGISMVVAQFL